MIGSTSSEFATRVRNAGLPGIKTLILALIFGLAANSFALAQDTGCAAFKWPVTREQALFAAAPATASGAALKLDQAADLTLAPIDEVSFAVAPEHAPKPDTFGGTLGLDVPGMATIQITLSGEAWIDVLQNGKAVESSDYSGVKTCPGIRKSVRFKLAGGATIIQLSGAREPGLKVAILATD